MFVSEAEKGLFLSSKIPFLGSKTLKNTIFPIINTISGSKTPFFLSKYPQKPSKTPFLLVN
jgi:hypothetical protein